MHLFGSFREREREDSVLILRKVAQFVSKIDKQELRRELLRNVSTGARK
jgi:hypothetical protein